MSKTPARPEGSFFRGEIYSDNIWRVFQTMSLHHYFAYNGYSKKFLHFPPQKCDINCLPDYHNHLGVFFASDRDLAQVAISYKLLCPLVQSANCGITVLPHPALLPHHDFRSAAITTWHEFLPWGSGIHLTKITKGRVSKIP